MPVPLKVRFVRSFSQVAQLPHVFAELALVGRSNVGKSSLINALAKQKSLAKTSKAPGATKLLNGFEVGPQGSMRWLMDLPGYGYANVSQTEKRRWAKMINDYIEQRENLKAVLLLVDAKVGPTKLDLQALAWLNDLNQPTVFVATKTDQVRAANTSKSRQSLVQKLGVETADIFWVSTHTGNGIDALRKKIQNLLAL